MSKKIYIYADYFVRKYLLNSIKKFKLFNDSAALCTLMKYGTSFGRRIGSRYINSSMVVPTYIIRYLHFIVHQK